MLLKKKYRGNRRWTVEELHAILKIEHEHGSITYQNPVVLEDLFFLYTGQYRASGTIYFAYWRLKNGKYDQLLVVEDLQKQFYFFPELR